MKSIKLSSGNTATLPEGWHEVSVVQSLAIDGYKDYKATLEFGLDEWGRAATEKGYYVTALCPEVNTVSKWLQLPKDDAIALINATAWLSEPPVPDDIGNRITLNGQEYKVCTDFNSLTTLQWMYIQELQKAAAEREEDTELALNFAALMIRPIDCEAYTLDVMEANIEALKSATVTQLAGIAAFFLHMQLTQLSVTLPYTTRAPLLAMLKAKRYTSNTGGGIYWRNWLKGGTGQSRTSNNSLLTRFLRSCASGAKRLLFNELKTSN